MKFVTVLVFFVLLFCGCESKKQFTHDMESRYEVKCDEYYATYGSSNIQDAKKALYNIIDFSQEEKSKAKFYWRFDVVIAFAYARLGMIAEKQGNEDEAKKMFASASDYKASGDAAFHLEEKNEPWIKFSSNTNIIRITRDQWRKGITKIDKQQHVKWEFGNSVTN